MTSCQETQDKSQINTELIQEQTPRTQSPQSAMPELTKGQPRRLQVPSLLERRLTRLFLEKLKISLVVLSMEIPLSGIRAGTKMWFLQIRKSMQLV